MSMADILWQLQNKPSGINTQAETDRIKESMQPQGIAGILQSVTKPQLSGVNTQAEIDRIRESIQPSGINTQAENNRITNNIQPQTISNILKLIGGGYGN